MSINMLAAVQPLVIPVTPIAGESLAGFVARSAQENVVSQPRAIFEDVGITDPRPGYIGMHADAFSAPLAVKLGCSEAAITSRAHPCLGAVRACPSVTLRLGAGEIIRGDLDLERRRISPISLATSNHHRSHWLNLLLPYCPESLEQLIDHCHCGARLAWFRTIGINRCETCGEIVRNISPKFLPEQWAEDYRFFAALMSAEVDEQRSALSTLDPVIANFASGPRINLILRLGAIGHDPQIFTRRTAAHNLPALNLARMCSLGAYMLRDWPNNLREKIGETLDRCRSAEGNVHARAAQAIRVLTKKQFYGTETRELLTAALPEAKSNSGIALSGSLRPVVRAAEACLLTSIPTGKLHLLREAGAISYVRIGGSQRTIAQYDRGEILDLTNRIRNSRVLSAMAFRRGIPEYALEQLICLNRIDLEDHPAMTLLYDRPRCTGASVDSFFAGIEATTQAKLPPPAALPLAVAMRMFGGATKPWGPVLAAIFDRTVPSWARVSAKLTRRLLVDPVTLRSFSCSSFDEANYPNFRFSAEFTQCDAAEVLNMTWTQMAPIEEAGELVLEKAGTARFAQRSHVLNIAKRHVATGEAAWRIGCSSDEVRRVMRDYPNVERRVAGWDRYSFDRTFGRL